MKKDRLRLDAWPKKVAPRDVLRKWYGHGPARWDGFQSRYFAELDVCRDAWQPILQAEQRGDVTLVYGARDTEHNDAVALKAYLEEK